MAQKIFTDQSWSEFATGISALKAKSDGTNIAYGTCSTAAATAAKVITTVGDTEWNLKAGSFITILFSATNTAKNPTFNVNGTGAKNVFYTTTQITSSSLSYAGYANRPMNFMYDGTQYRFIGWGVDSNSDTKVNQKEITTNANYSVLLGSNNTTAAATTGTYKSTKLKYNPSTDILTVGTVNGNLDGTATNATNASSATYSTNSGTSTYSSNSAKATTATNAGTATYAKNSGTASALSGLTATIAELNYVDGVTSAIQTQLNGKVPTSRTINGKALTGNLVFRQEITQAAYDALGDEKLTNGIEYFITDADANSVSSGIYVENSTLYIP